MNTLSKLNIKQLAAIFGVASFLAVPVNANEKEEIFSGESDIKTTSEKTSSQKTAKKKTTRPAEEMVVVGYRYPTRQENVAGSVTLIDSESIESIQASNIADVLQNQPGVDVESDSRFGIRSINVRGLSGNYIKIKVDNVDQPAEFDGGTFIGSSRIDLDVDLLKSIEIVKGPASSTQGSEAMGGSVLFSTVDPVDVHRQSENGFGGWIKTGVQSIDSGQHVSLAVANRHNAIETLLALVNRSGESIDSFGYEPDRESDANTVLGKLIYHLNDDHQLKFSAELVKTNTDGEPYSVGSYDDFYFTEDTSQRSRFGLAHEWSANNFFFDDSVIQFNWQQKEQESNTFRKALSGNAENKAYEYEEDSQQIDIQFTKSSTPISRKMEHNLAHGLSYKQAEYENINITWYDDNGDGNINDRSRQYFYTPAADSTALGIFLQDEMVFLEGRLRITPGIRFDRFTVDPQALDLDLATELTGYSPTNTYEEYQDEEFTGRLGVVYAINYQLRVFSQYSQGFKSPDFRQLYYSWSNDMFGYKSEPNPDLKSEHSDSFEIGLRGNSHSTSWEVVVFKSEYEDFIERQSDYSDPSYPFGVTRFENVREAEIKGAEVSSQWQLGETLDALNGFSLRIAAAYADGETNEGEPLESVNPLSANVRFSYDAPSQYWGAALTMNYAGAVDSSDVINANNQYLPDSYTVMDLNLYWQPVNNFTVRAGVNNITDKQYERWSNVRGLAESDFEDRYSQSGRQWALTAKYQF